MAQYLTYCFIEHYYFHQPSLGLVGFLPRQSLAIAALIVVLGLALYAVQQRIRAAP
jgi:hypothetical protein